MSSVGTASNQNGYGGMAYYTSETCGYVNNSWVETGCTTDYEESEVKYTVDTWKTANAPAALEARLITKDEIDNNFEFEEVDCCGGCGSCTENLIKETWMYNSNYKYWTMSPSNSLTFDIWGVNNRGSFVELRVSGYDGHGGDNGGNYRVVRPVIVLPKSALSS